MAGIHVHVKGFNLGTLYCLLIRWRPWKKNQVALTHILQPAAGQPPGMHCTSLIDILIKTIYILTLIHRFLEKSLKDSSNLKIYSLVLHPSREEKTYTKISRNCEQLYFLSYSIKETFYIVSMKVCWGCKKPSRGTV
jgi:hypothetical protein